MIKAALIIVGVALSGCLNYFASVYKCDNGVLYIYDGGVWIQALMYKDNKCLPREK